MKRMQTRLKYFHFTRCRTFENCIERKRYLQAFYQISTYVATKIGGEQKKNAICRGYLLGLHSIKMNCAKSTGRTIGHGLGCVQLNYT